MSLLRSLNLGQLFMYENLELCTIFGAHSAMLLEFYVHSNEWFRTMVFGVA